jgi:hypothetical protein
MPKKILSYFDRKSPGVAEDFLGATLEQTKDGSKLVSATEATTWIEFAST